MTREEFKQWKELDIKLGEACQEYLDSKQTFDNEDWNPDEDKNEWNYVDDYDVWNDEVHFIVDTSGYKREGEQYILTVSIDEILK